MISFMKKTKEVLLLILIQILIFFILILSKTYDDHMILKILYIMIILLQICSCFALYWLFKRTSKQIELETKQSYLIKQRELQQEHLLVSKELDQNFELIREDLKRELQNMQLQESLDVTSIRQLTAKLMEKYKDLYHINYCENKIVDAILYNKSIKAKALGIDTQIQVILPEQLPIDDLDLISIYANLLDNAIEANEKLEISKRFLAISSMIKDHKLFLKIENNKLPSDVILLSHGVTSKQVNKEAHGFGLQIIKSTIESYDGFLEIDDQKHLVKITAYLQLATKEEK